MIDIIVRVFGTDYPHPHCKLLALAIARRCGSEHGLCWAGIPTLMKDTGLTRSAFYRARKLMEEHEVAGQPAPFLKRWGRPSRADGRRRSDLIALRFPAVTLPEIDAQVPAAEIASGQLSLWEVADLEAGQFEEPKDGENPAGGILVEAGSENESQIATDRVPNSDTEESLEETNDSLRVRTREWPVSEAGVFDPELGAEWLWDLAPERSCDRSTIPETMAALSLALKERKPSGQHHGDWFSMVAKAVELYAESPGAVKEAGRYCHGLHRLLQLEKFWDEWFLRAGRVLAPAGVKMLDLSRPDPEMQRLFMRGWAKSGFWSERQGPRPDEPGCHISPEILAEFGVPADAAFPVMRRRLVSWFKRGEWHPGWGPKPDEDGAWIDAGVLGQVAAELAADQADADLQNASQNMHSSMHEPETLPADPVESEGDLAALEETAPVPAETLPPEDDDAALA